jgi:hypothetical protein
MDNITLNEGQVSQDKDNEIPAPSTQPLVLRIAGHLVSYIFHPLFIPTYVTYFLLYIEPYAFAGASDRMKLFKLASIFFNTAFLPGFAVFLMYQLRLINSMFLKTQRERIIPYAVAMVFYFWAWYVSKNQTENPPIYIIFLLGTFLAVCGTWLLNINNKVSMHSTAMGGILCFFILLAFSQHDTTALYLSAAILVAGLVCTARFIVSDHTQPEIYLGFVMGVVCQLVAAWLQ